MICQVPQKTKKCEMRCNSLFFNIVMFKMRFANFLSTFFIENIGRNLYC